jgi:hypothetical protein
LGEVADDIIDVMLHDTQKLSLKEYLEEMCYDNVSKEEAKKLFDKYANVYVGEAADDSGSAEAVLCDMDIRYDTKELYVEKEGGY